MSLKRESVSTASVFEAPAMTQAAIRQLVADSVTAALEAQAVNMANADNTNRKPKPREASIARKCSYKEFMSCQPFNFKGSKEAVGLIRWFEHTESVFSLSNCTEDCKVKFVTDDGSLHKGLPQSIEGNVTTYKPQTLEEDINIAQRLMDQNIRQEAFRAYAATPAENNRERALCKLVPKDHQQQHPGKSLHAKGYEFSPKPKCSHGIICDEKVVHISLDDETLIIQGDQIGVDAV
nr:reverse transcriptase domain-containing protein [Tanacetum cinerariifolium]